MPRRLKAYKNLDLRPHEVDAFGRLTSAEERGIISDFAYSYGSEKIRLPYSTIDMAIARNRGVKPHQLMIVVRQKELPLTDRIKDPDAIVGVLLGHMADDEDKKILKAFKSLKQSYRLRPKIDSVMDDRPVIMIDMFLNTSQLGTPNMIALLMRKLQESRYGKCMSILCWYTTSVTPRLSAQLAQFGYQPYGIGNFDDMKNPLIMTGKCLAWWSMETFDIREGRNSDNA